MNAKAQVPSSSSSFSLMVSLLLCFLWCLAVIPAPVYSDCTNPRQVDASLFFSTPQVPIPPLTRCQASGTKACCSAQYTTQIDQRVDRVHAGIASRFNNLAPSCEAYFDELACVYCSPNQAAYISTTPQSYDLLHVCESFCDRFLAACASAVIKTTGKTIGETYTKGKDFCTQDGSWYSVFVPSVISSASGDACYDPDSQACTVDDIVGDYTECDTVHKTRNLIYHWKQRSDGTHCTPGAVQLPQSIFGLPCDISCGPGKYLPLGKTECAPCAPGTYSVGGGARFDDWGEPNELWPTKQRITFQTYAQDSVTKQPKGNPWVKHGSYIESGNNTEFVSMESVLEMTATLVRNGYLTFEVKVDSEIGYDGLRLEIDNVKININEANHQFKRLSYNLTSGIHVIRWIYYKDYSWSVGEDRAFINMIEIEGISYADDKCDTCPPGTFAPRSGTAECIPCTTPGFIPNGDPPTNCIACGEGTTALPYDSECRPKLNCTTNDYERHFSECRPPYPGSRDMTWGWTYPHICDDRYLPLPPPQYNLTCPPCAPGQQRSASAACLYCSDGHYSNETTNGLCTECPRQSVAIKSQTYASFQFPIVQGNTVWPNGWSTGCDHCDSKGFRPHYDYLDSGDGEGLFNSWLEINSDFYTSGSLAVVALMDCPAFDCSMRIWVDNTIEDMAFSTGNQEQVYKFTVPIKSAGTHKLTIDFARWVPLLSNHEHENTMAKITSIVIAGVQPGGASSCYSCPAGSVASSDRISCNKCPAGQIPSSSGVCVNCPINSITLDEGSSECILCGAGTKTTAPGQRTCTDNNCAFSAHLAPDWPVTFNITPIASQTAMYGPIYSGRTSYYFSMCTKPTNSSCKAPDGRTTLDSFACKENWFGGFMNAGRLLNFIYDPPADPAEEKLVIQYTHGDICDYAQFKRHLVEPGSFRQDAQNLNRLAREQMMLPYQRDDQASERRMITNVTLICDPVAGIGVPQAPSEGVEDQACALNFVWYSMYGCHICTENDYDYRYTSCENGYRTKVYFWKYNPKRCWGGISMLPQSTVETCTNTEIVCPDGQSVSGKFDNCTLCPAGNYSVSGGELIQWWTYESMTQYGFIASCTKHSGEVDPNCDDGWKPEGINVASQGHMEGSAVLYTERTFLRDGSITFDFTLITENDQPFEFLIDNNLVMVWNHTTMQGSTTYKANIRMGYHTFKWRFSPFLKEEKVRQAVIHSVAFRGLGNSRPYCSTCPAPLVALNRGASMCTACPANTVYKNPTTCEPCAANEYALPGDSVCRPRLQCEAQDFYQIYTPCVAGQRDSMWLPAEPRICYGTPSGLQNKTGIPCASCPAGTHRETSQGPCVSCAAGQYYESNLAQCAIAPPGTASVMMLEYFTGNDGTSLISVPPTNKRDLPDGWATGCRGVCGTAGWRLLGDHMDSGMHFKQADSWISYTTQLLSDGYITFLVNASSHFDIGPSVAAEFFIDNVPQPLHDLSAHTYTFSVPAGRHTFLWLHHQDEETLRGDIRTVVSKIRILGASSGGYVAYECPIGYIGAGGTNPCTICPPGSYSHTTKSTRCDECPAGYFSSLPGTDTCTKCGSGTVPNKEKAATGCITDCIFVANVTHTATKVEGNYTFDLTRFKQMGPITVQTPISKKFTLGICNKLTDTQSSCKSTSTFVCETDSDLHESFEAGNLLNFSPNQPEPDSHNVAAGFTLEYSMGSQAGCPKMRKTYVHFMCQLGATPYLVEYVDQSTRQCEYHINIKSEYACPACNDFDLTKIVGSCEINGERIIRYESSVPCVGVPASIVEKCSDVEVNEWAIVITAGIMVISTVGLLTLAVYFWRKKAQSEQKYALLVQETTAPVEMQDFDDADDDPSLSRA